MRFVLLTQDSNMKADQNYRTDNAFGVPIELQK